MAVRESKLHLLVLDDDNIVCLHHGQAVMLTKVALSCAQRLLDILEPAKDRQFNITPPARSAELALKANGPIDGQGRRYPMTKAMVMVLNNIAALDEPISTDDVINLMTWKRGSATSKLSMLVTNGYLTRVEAGKYLASPEGQLYLREHSTS